MKRRSILTAGPVALLGAGCSTVAGTRPGAGDGGPAFSMRPIGQVELDHDQAAIRILAPYVDGLLGLDAWSHVQVLYWFDRNDTPEKRRVLRVHPRGNRENPLTGVFACRSPFRPNLIALSLCRILAVEGAVVRIDGMDALDGTPVLDLKPYTPADAATGEVRVPDWARRASPNSKPDAGKATGRP